MGRAEFYYDKKKELYRKRKKIGGQPMEFYGRTKDDVREQIREAELAHHQGLRDAGNMTFRAYATQWYALKTSSVGASMAAGYETALNKHINPLIGDKLLADIVRSDLLAIMARLASQSESLNHKVYITLRQVFDSAVDDRLIKDSPCKKIPRGGKKPEKVSALTTVQQKEVIRAAKGEHLYLLALLCLFCGLRPEEARGLQWDNVHLMGVPYLKVKHAVVYDSIATFTDQLKSGASYRDIPIPDQLAKALRKVPKAARQGFVVPAIRSNTHISESSYNRCWKQIKDKINPSIIPYGITPHKHLRRTYITELCASGMDIKKIQYLAGHDDIKVTLAIYAEVVNNRPEQVIDHINSVFSGIAV